MLTIFLSPKGGSGTTVIAAAHALAAAANNGRSVLVDLCGDAPAVLGMAEPDAPGVNDWLAENHTAGAADLLALGTAQGAVLVIHRGARYVNGAPRWESLLAAVGEWDFPVIVDAGTHFIPDSLRGGADRTYMVTRQCYLALRRATRLPRADGVVLVKEPGRVLTPKDVESVLGTGVVATVPVDPSIARAVDAGVLPQRHDELLSACLAPIN